MKYTQPLDNLPQSRFRSICSCKHAASNEVRGKLKIKIIKHDVNIKNFWLFQHAGKRKSGAHKNIKIVL